ncbi:MAG: hypothetical protein ABII00_05615, partial [Elusimicrobiota bacterium]
MFTAAFLLMVFGAPVRAADIAPLINFQGRLVIGGSPVTGTSDITFRIFDVEADGTALWTETQAGVATVEGVFSVQLGGVQPLTADLFSNAALYLEIEVGGKTLSPRERLASSSYAFNAQRLQGAELASFVTKDANGNVGIGTSSPVKKLDVAGGVRGTELCIGADCRTAWPT